MLCVLFVFYSSIVCLCYVLFMVVLFVVGSVDRIVCLLFATFLTLEFCLSFGAARWVGWKRAKGSTLCAYSKCSIMQYIYRLCLTRGLILTQCPACCLARSVNKARHKTIQEQQTYTNTTTENSVRSIWPGKPILGGDQRDFGQRHCTENRGHPSPGEGTWGYPSPARASQPRPSQASLSRPSSLTHSLTH